MKNNVIYKASVDYTNNIISKIVTNRTIKAKLTNIYYYKDNTLYARL